MNPFTVKHTAKSFRKQKSCDSPGRKGKESDVPETPVLVRGREGAVSSLASEFFPWPSAPGPQWLAGDHMTEFLQGVVEGGQGQAWSGPKVPLSRPPSGEQLFCSPRLSQATKQTQCKSSCPWCKLSWPAPEPVLCCRTLWPPWWPTRMRTQGLGSSSRQPAWEHRARVALTSLCGHKKFSTCLRRPASSPDCSLGLPDLPGAEDNPSGHIRHCHFTSAPSPLACCSHRDFPWQMHVRLGK